MSTIDVDDQRPEILRLHVRGLPPKKDEKEFRQHIESIIGSKIPFGGITDVKVINKVSTGNSRRFGFLGCRDLSTRRIVEKELNNTYWENSKLGVSVAVPSSEVNLFNCSSEISRKKAERIKNGVVLSPKTEPQKAKHAKRKEIEASNNALIGKTNRLLVENLPYTLSNEDITEQFQKFGTIADMKMLEDELTGKFIGKCFIEFDSPDSAADAISHFEGNPAGIAGRQVWVQAVREHTDFDDDEHKAVAGASSSYKRIIEKKRKAEAGDSKQWNLLYISSHAAVETMAKRLGIESEDLMALGSGDSLAARAALAESHLVVETKKWLHENGISEDSFIRSGSSLEKAQDFRKTAKRSTDTIILKHLPMGATPENIQTQFGEFGPLCKVLISPSQTLGLVQYLHDKDAKKAFQRLVLTPLIIPCKKNMIPLYLEWAPMDVFDESAGPKKALVQELEEHLDAVEREDEEAASEEEIEATQEVTKEKKEIKPTSPVPTIIEDFSGEHYLFVRNISFDTSLDTLRSTFSKLKGYKGFKLPMKKRTRRDGTVEELSSGYGFCYFQDETALERALGKMSGVSLDGHLLKLEKAKKKETTVEEAKQNDEGGLMYKGVHVSPKLIVKNLPFQATEKDVKKIFGTTGAVKNVRLPVNRDGRIRGFAFVQMASEKEALSAMQSIGDVHLYGRRLNIDFAAQNDTSIAAVTERAKNKRDREYEANKPRDTVKRRLRRPEDEEEQ